MPGRTDTLKPALDRLAAENFSETGKAIEEIAASGASHAADILAALAERRLFVAAGGKAVFYTAAAGAAVDARTALPLGVPPANAAAVRINNRLRSAIEAALGGLTLMSPDPARRIAAAEAVFRTRDTGKLQAIEAALARERHAAALAALTAARAAILAVKADAPNAARFEAIAALRARGDREALTILKSLPADTPPGLKTAAAQAATAIEDRLALWGAAQNVWYGLSLGSVLLLAAIGLAITFGVMGVFNMAHGEMVMLGAYTTYVVQESIRTSAPALFGYSLALSIPLAFLIAGLAGIAIERGIIRFLYGRPLETLLATWGVSLILQQAVRTVFGATNREVGAPEFMTGTFKIGELSITWNRLWIVVLAGLVFAALLTTIRATSFGLQMRAVTQNRQMAGSMGIRTPWVDALTFGLGSGIAGLAGVALSQIDNVSPNLGQSYIVDSFLVVVFGGVGNLWGTLIAALSLGVANKLLEPYAGAVLGKILLLVLIVLFIQRRPRGLFALKGRAVEA
ncbi:MAG: urea ABC transporter permease subunit UrtB [Hyphomicrobiaceae bacterium]